MERGKFITLEGGEGAGKSTQVPYLKAFLESYGCQTVITREPGGSPGAELIRKLLVHGTPIQWDPLTEYLLLSAARRDHIETLIKPALEQGKWVICDRFFDSSHAYQGSGGGVKEEILYQIYNMIAPDFEPDVTFIFDLPVDIGLQRTRERAALDDWFEKMSVDFHQRIRNKFTEILEKNPQRCYLVNAQDSIENISNALQKHLMKFLK